MKNKALRSYGFLFLFVGLMSFAAIETALSLGAPYLYVTVVDGSSGLGIEGATVAVYVNESSDPLAPSYNYVTSLTNENGTAAIGIGEFYFDVIVGVIAENYTSVNALGDFALYQSYTIQVYGYYLTLTLTPLEVPSEPSEPEPVTRTLTGYVQDFETAQKLSGVTVEVAGPDYRGTTTDATGWFRFNSLTSGKYKLTASLDGYHTSTIQSLDLTNNDLYNLVVFLTPSSSEPINITDNYVVPDQSSFEPPTTETQEPEFDYSAIPVVLVPSGLFMIALSYYGGKKK